MSEEQKLKEYGTPLTTLFAEANEEPRQETDLVQARTDEARRIQRKNAAEVYWRIPWTEFEVVLGLRNPLTLRTMGIDSYERSAEYLKNCGFDITDPEHRRRFEQFYGEAIYLVRHVLMSLDERKRFPVPEELLRLEDPRRLPLIASDRAPRRRYKRLWACALFKVFQAIANLEYSDKLRNINEARDQIFGRVKALLHTGPDNITSLIFRGEEVKLHAIDWKESKTRTSIILKILHKPESVVDEVFDYLGVRFVVENEYDLPRLLKLLIEADIIIPNQVLAIRTRNNLLSIKKARRLLDILCSLVSMDRIDVDEFYELCKRIPWTFGPTEEVPKPRNAFSSAMYRSLQLTVRHLARFPNPSQAVVDSLTQQVRHYRGLDRDDPSLSWVVPSEIVRYFPVEIQVMDAHAYDAARFGAASHERYKAAQLNEVRERVLAGMLYFSDEKIATQEL